MDPFEILIDGRDPRDIVEITGEQYQLRLAEADQFYVREGDPKA